MSSLERKLICNKCIHLKNQPWRNCELCHCFVDLKVKFQNEKCPKGKW